MIDHVTKAYNFKTKGCMPLPHQIRKTLQIIWSWNINSNTIFRNVPLIFSSQENSKWSKIMNLIELFSNFIKEKKLSSCHLPLSNTFRCFSKNSFSILVTFAQLPHMRTGSTKHMRGRATLFSQQRLQNRRPQRRQWCCKITVDKLASAWRVRDEKKSSKEILRIFLKELSIFNNYSLIILFLMTTFQQNVFWPLVVF